MALVWKGDRAEARLRLWTRKHVQEAVLIVEAIVKTSMKAGGRTESGKAVKKPGTKRTMIDPVSGKKAGKINSYRSKPGEVPRVQTSRLRRSITTEMHKTLPIGRVGTNVKYGKWLEFGTRRMAPRPFMRPALKKAAKVIQANMSKDSSMKGPV